MNKKSIEEIFGIRKGSVCAKEMRLLVGGIGVDGAKVQIYRDEDGKYHLDAEPVEEGKEARLGLGAYMLDEKITMPVSREAALFWSDINLYGNELESAMKEFGDYASDGRIVWEHLEAANAGQPDIREWLMKSKEGDFVLYSTDDSYPLCCGSTVLSISAENGKERFDGDVYIYYIPKETARRWAEVYEMDTDTYTTVFGSSEA